MSTISYKCPNCGGELLFDPATQSYRCEYCISSFSGEEMDQLYREEEQQQEPFSNGVVYSCPSCGAEIVTDETTAATFCYYCHNPVVLSGRLSGDYLPDQIIPFQITREQAESRFLEWIRKKKFVPKDLFRKEHLQKISGVYFPYWMMDYEIEGHTVSRAKGLRIWRTGNTEYTETTEYELERDGRATLKNYGKNALKTVHTKLIEGVMPFRIEECKPFRMNYLTGFQAEKRNIERGQLEPEVRAEMLQHADALFRQSEGSYTAVQRREEDFRVKDCTWMYALFPVWILTFVKKERIYYFAMNGQTGEVCGAVPLDKKKLRRSSLLWGVVTFLIALIGGLVTWL